MMRKKLVSIIMCAVLLITALPAISVNAEGDPKPVFSQKLDYITDTASGKKISPIDTGDTGFGFNIKNSTHIVYEDFVLDKRTDINEIEIFAYQTGSSTTSTFTGMYLQILDGDPEDPDTKCIWGNRTDNIMSQTGFTGVYKVVDDYQAGNIDTNRPIMSVKGETKDLILDAGTYWVAVSLSGTGSSGPWVVFSSNKDLYLNNNVKQFVINNDNYAYYYVDHAMPLNIYGDILEDNSGAASWVPMYINLPIFSLSFNTNGGDELAAVYNYVYKTVMLNDYIPQREGYVFEGWYSDAALTNRVTYAFMTANTVVYAKWTPAG